MRTPAEVAKSLRGCIICERLPIVAVGCLVAADDDTYNAVMRLRGRPISEDETPAICYGLCRTHAANAERSKALAKKRILLAAETVVAH